MDDGTLPYMVNSLPNIQYLTGFDGSHAIMLVTFNSVYFISDARYEEYACSILPSGVNFILQDGEITGTLKELLSGEKLRELYLEEHSMVLGQYFQFKDALKGIKLRRGGDVVNDLRMVKDDDEISILDEAVSITDQCLSHIIGMIKPGIFEWDIAVEIEYFYKTNGCSGSSFDPIVASGAGSSRPHYKTSELKKIESGDILLIDMGCTYRGYNSDLTRTVFVHSITDEFREIYNIVRRAQETAIRSVRPGVSTGTLDSRARDVIIAGGYGDYFGHSLGHGVGMEVHELPAVKSGGSVRLKKNTVITVEPGIYLPGKGGVRIEDMVRAGSKGAEVMTGSAKDILIV